MRIYTLRKELIVHRPMNVMFAFFSRPENLAVITPPALGFQILTPSPIDMRKDAVIDYTVKIMGVRMRWQSLITAYEPPFMFVDEQSEGPYDYWQHTHTLSEVPDGTKITDEVRYALPFGWLGQLAHGPFIRPRLEHIFEYRSRIINELFGTKIQLEESEFAIAGLEGIS